jgi:hypothetical protein
MASEDIGALYTTKIPGYEDAADIQAALRLFHYGSTTYDETNTDPTQLPNPSLARHLQDLRDDITTIEGQGTGSDYLDVSPAQYPTGKPDGFIWVDATSVAGNGAMYTIAIYSNTAPTQDLIDGIIWIDKDAVLPTAYVYDAGTSSWVPFSETQDLSDYVTLTGTQTLSNKTLDSALMVSPKEKTTVFASSGATGTVNFDMKTQGILYYTANATNDFTLNFRGDSSTTLNSIMSTGDSISAVFMNTNGLNAYLPTSITIDGSAVTPKWFGGTAPTSGNASSIDSYSFTIIKTASGVFTVLAGQVKFA